MDSKQHLELRAILLKHKQEKKILKDMQEVLSEELRALEMEEMCLQSTLRKVQENSANMQQAEQTDGEEMDVQEIGGVKVCKDEPHQDLKINNEDPLKLEEIDLLSFNMNADQVIPEVDSDVEFIDCLYLETVKE